MDQSENREELARKTARAKLDFIRHLFIYGIIIAALVIINNITGGDYQWWIWPAIGWGAGVLFHFLNVYTFRSGTLEKKLIDKELKKLDEDQ